MSRESHYVNGKIDAPQLYELRINGEARERSGNLVDLLWKARRAVNGTNDRSAVEAVSGFGFHAFFSDKLLHDWERA